MDSTAPNESTSWDEGSRTDGMTVDAGTSDHQRVNYTYDDLGHPNLATVTDQASGTAFSVTDTDFDDAGQLRRSRILEANGTTVHSSTSFNYASDGLITSLIDGRGFESVNEYDSRGLLTKTIAALGATHHSVYTGNAESIEQVTEYQYYSDGSPKTVFHPHVAGTPEAERNATRYFADPSQRQTWEVTSGVSNGAHRIAADSTIEFNVDDRMVVRTTTDTLGRTTNVVNWLTGQETDYEYEDIRHDVPTSVSSRYNTGTQVTTQTTRFQYDAAGNVILTDAPGTAAVRTEYDELGYPKETKVLTTNGSRVEYETDAAGKRGRHKRTPQDSGRRRRLGNAD